MKTIKIITPYEVIRIEDINDQDVEIIKNRLDSFIDGEFSGTFDLQLNDQSYWLTVDVLKKSLIHVY